MVMGHPVTDDYRITLWIAVPKAVKAVSQSIQKLQEVRTFVKESKRDGGIPPCVVGMMKDILALVAGYHQETRNDKRRGKRRSAYNRRVEFISTL